MEQKINYSRRLEEIIANLGGEVPKLLMHSCCGPCSSYCLEYLSQYFSITVLYYDPNISPEEEYRKRENEQRRLIGQLPTKHKVTFVPDRYDPNEFYSAVKGHENDSEGGERCMICYRLRLGRAAEYAAENGFDYFCSTLSISPMKNCAALNRIGGELSEIYNVKHLPNDFKKHGGYLRSIELSREYGMYRQNYCGCVFSKREAERRDAERAAREKSE